MDFKGLTGNEIILALMDGENLNQVELVRGIVALSNVDKALEINWNGHEVVLECLDHVFNMKNQLSFDSYLDLIISFDKLNIEDQEIYEMFFELFQKMHGKLKADNFGKVFNILMSKEYISEEAKN